MKGILTSVVLTIGLLSPAFAQSGQNGQNGPNGQQGQNGQQGGSGIRSAPAPLIGAGLPGLAVAMGYGVYWLVRRRRNVG